MKDADYICPQCGSDPRGEVAHAEAMHTFVGRWGDERKARSALASMCETVMQCVIVLEKEARSPGDDGARPIEEAARKLRAAVLAAT